MLFMWPIGKAQAVGIYGDVEVLSALNEPLKLNFPIIVEGESWDESDILVSVASRKEYTELELPFPKKIHKLKFTVGKKLNGRINVVATTKFIIREPVISLLIYVQWPKGKIRYEFTLLLDLPEVKNQQQSPLTTNTIAPIKNNDSVLKAIKVDFEKNKPRLQTNHVSASRDTTIEQVEVDINDSQSVVELTPVSNLSLNPPVYFKEEKEKPYITIQPFKILDSEVLPEIVSEVVIGTTPQIVWNTNYKKHIIRNGDSLSTVAMNYRGNAKIALHKYIAAITTHNAAAFKNGLNEINVGDELSIPNPKSVNTQRKNPAQLPQISPNQKYYSYIVKYGDILSLVAQRLRGPNKIGLNQYIAQIISANKTLLNKQGSNLSPGMILQIPNLHYVKSKNQADTKKQKIQPHIKQSAVLVEDTVEAKPFKIKKTKIVEKLKTTKPSVAVKSPVFIANNAQNINPLLMSISDLKQQSLITSLEKLSTQPNNNLVYKANVEYAMARTNGVIIIGQTAVVNTNSFKIKQKNTPSNNAIVQTEGSQQYQTNQISYRYLQQQMEREKSAYQASINNLKLGFFAILIVLVLLFVGFYFYMQKSMHKKFEKWLETSNVEFKNDQTVEKKQEEEEELEDALATLLEDDLELDTNVEIEENTDVLASIFDGPEEEKKKTPTKKAALFLKSSLMEMVTNKFKKKARTPIIEKPIFTEPEAQINQFENDETLFSRTDYADVKQELNVDDVNLDFNESDYFKEKDVNLSQSDIDNEFVETIKLGEPLVSEANFDHLSLADQPVQQPMLPSDMSLSDDFEVSYTTDIDGELEKEKQRIIENLEVKNYLNNVVEQNDNDLTRFSKPKTLVKNNRSPLTNTPKNNQKIDDDVDFVLEPSEYANNTDDLTSVKDNANSIFNDENAMLTDELNYLRDEVDEDVVKQIASDPELDEEDTNTVLSAKKSQSIEESNSIENLGLDEQIAYIKAEIDKEEMEQMLLKDAHSFEVNLSEDENVNKQEDLLAFDMPLDDDSETDIEESQSYKDIGSHLTMTLEEDNRAATEAKNQETVETIETIETVDDEQQLVANGNNLKEIKPEDDFESLSVDESKIKETEASRERVEKRLKND